MAVPLHPSPTPPEPQLGFGPGSPVREYWLERCVGFRLLDADGKPLGRVIDVVEDAEDEEELVLVCRRGLRRQFVAAADVDTVWPAHFLLVLADEPATDPGLQPPEDTPPRGERVRELAGRAGGRIGAAAGASGVALRRLGGAALALLARGPDAAQRLGEAVVALVRHAAVQAGRAYAAGRRSGSALLRELRRAGSAGILRLRRTLASLALRLARRLEPGP
jgi:hypothetical protein